jgi:hypothetical protein
MDNFSSSLWVKNIIFLRFIFVSPLKKELPEISKKLLMEKLLKLKVMLLGKEKP